MSGLLSIIDNAIVSLDDPTAENRQAIYTIARSIRDRPGGVLSDLAEGDVLRGRAALDEVIALVETSFVNGDAMKSFSEPTARYLALGERLDQADCAQKPPNRRQFAFNAAFSGVVSVLKTLLQLALLPLLARLLGPNAYGIYSLAFPTVLFFIAIGDGGLGLSLSREDEDNRLVWSTAFWTLIGVCSVLAVAVVIAGFFLARVSGQPSLVGLMAFLSLALPLLAISLPADARLLRRGNLLYHSASDLAGSVLGAGVALALAYKGAGAWALAAQYVTSFALKAVILNTAAWSLPDFVFDLRSLRGHISTGGALLVGRLGELGTKLAENTAFSHLFGAGPLGSYTLATQMSRFTCDAVTNPVTGSFYAQALRESDEEVAGLHAKLIRIMLIILMPFTGLMAVAAPTLFPFVLGEKWTSAAPLFQAIAICYPYTAVSWLCGQILLKHGMTNRSTKVILVSGVVRILAVVTGLWVSPVVVAWLVGGSYIFQGLTMTLAVPHGLRLSLRSLLRSVRGPAVAAAIATATSWSLIVVFPGIVLPTLCASVTGACTYLILLWLTDGNALRNDLEGFVRLTRWRTL